MYSHEIQQLLELKNYVLSVEEYLNILNTSPQINHIKCDFQNDNIFMETDDNYKMKFKLKERFDNKRGK